MESPSTDAAVATEASHELAGTRLYKPGLLFAYFALGGLPIGLVTYGVNISRRDSKWFGRSLAASAVVLFVVRAGASLGGNRSSGLGILSIFVGLGVFKMESGPYQRAVRRGARPERWWPPIVGAIGVVMVLALF